MASFRQAFEADLKTKLGAKSSSHTSDETVLLRAFKYFDLDNSGTVEQNEWLKALDRVGVNAVDQVQMLELFNLYDKDGNGRLDYAEFVAGVFGEQSAVGRSLQSKSSYVNYVAADEALQKIRDKLAQRGARGIIGFGRQFRIMDDDNSRSVDFYEFSKAVRDYRISIPENELQQIFGAIDKDGSGTIDYEEFLSVLRGPMNEFRRNLVLQAFAKLDTDGSGAVDTSEVRQIYDASNHPDVRSGKKTEDDILEEFLETFELHHAMEAQVDHIVTQDEFLGYYQNISASIDNDAYFEQMMNNAWKLQEAPAYTRKAAWSNVDEGTEARGSPMQPKRPQRQAVRSRAPAAAPTQVVSSDAVDQFRTQLASRGSRGIIGMQRQFKIMDDNNSKTLDFPEFAKACNDYRVRLSESQIQEVFAAFDRDRNGFIDYDEFLRILRGPMNEFRVNLVQQAFRRLDKDGSGVIDINDVRDVYSARNHPDVRSGKKTEDEVLQDFLETFELHHNISDRGQMDHRITIEEFMEYYNNISASIDDDAYFEAMMNSAWALKGKQESRQAWAGQIGGHEFNPNSKMQWMVDHHRSQFSGSVSRSAPYGTFDDPTDYRTELRPGADAADKLRIAEQMPTAGQPSWPNQMNTGGAAPGQASVDDLLADFRSKLMQRGARGIIGLSRQFRIMDDSGNKQLEYPEFVKAVHDYRISIPESDLQRVFSAFDSDRSGSVDYNEFLRVIRGELNEFRTQLVNQAFDKLDLNGNGVINAQDVKTVYNARNHPDVRMGKKTEDEILGEFLSTFETHHSILKGGAGLDQNVTREEFMEYYRNVSASIDDDQYFELMMKNAWNFDGRSVQKAWAGEVGAAPPAKQRYF